MHPFRTRPLDAASSAHLDMIRGLSAWAVLVNHLRALFFVDAHQLPPMNPALKAVYLMSGFGHQAVMIFFVLSGFFISSSIFKSFGSGTWSWRHYAVSRYVRLAIVLVPGLLFGLLWDESGRFLFASSGLYTHNLEGFGPSIAADNLSPRHFFASLFFLQTIVCPPLGSNGALWSLANEFWYYALFPLGLSAWLALGRGSWRAAIAFALLALGVGALLGGERLMGFVVWLMGTALVVVHEKVGRWAPALQRLYTLSSLLFLGASLYAARTGRMGVLGDDLMVGLAFSSFLVAVFRARWGARPLYRTVAHFVASFSYSLYVLHLPLLLFLRAWLAPHGRWLPDAVHLSFGLSIAAAIVVFAWRVGVVTEGKTQVVRDYLLARTAPRRFRTSSQIASR